MTWNTATPAGSDDIRDGDNIIRELKTDLQTALRGNASDGTEAKFPGADTANPIFRYRGLRGTTGAKPASGQYGLYANTTTNDLERDNGTTWDRVATLIPSGTAMVFYQAAAPTGWTKSAANNDRILRVVSGSGGVTGGSWANISVSGTTGSGGSHSHTVDSHTHSSGSFQAELDFDGDEIIIDVVTAGSNWSGDQRIGSVSDNGSSGGTRSQSIDVQGTSGSTAPGTSSDGSHTHSFSASNGTHGSTQHAYIDVIVATKD